VEKGALMMVAQTTAIEETGLAEALCDCLEHLGWTADLTPAGGEAYHLWAAKGRRVWLVQALPGESSASATERCRQALDTAAQEFRATPVVAGMGRGACWFASLRTGLFLEP